MSLHSGADGLVQCGAAAQHLSSDRFHQPCLLPWHTPNCHRNTAGCWAGIGEDCHPRTTWRPLTLAGSPDLPPSRLTGGIATSTRRYHGRMLIHPSPPACATSKHKGVCTHAGSGPSRVCHRLFWACLADPTTLVTQNRLLQYHLGVQPDLCIVGALPPIQHFSNDIYPSVRRNEILRPSSLLHRSPLSYF